MKKLIALLLVMVFVFALCACAGGGAGAADEKEQPAEVAEETAQEEVIKETQEPVSEEIIYEVGDTFGTDAVECTIDEVIWLTFEEVKAQSSLKNGSYLFDPETVYQGYKFADVGGWYIQCREDMFPSLVYLFSLKNIGKEAIRQEKGEPYGSIIVVYDDGYVIDGPYLSRSTRGLHSTLGVLEDPCYEGRIIIIPDEVYENEENSLMLKVSLPNSAGETEEFYVTVR